MAKLLFARTEQDKAELAQRQKKGEISRIRREIYTDAAPSEVESLVLNRWYEIVNFLLPDAVAAYRTAQELRPENKTVFVVSEGKTNRKIQVSNLLTIVLTDGNTTELTEPFCPGMFRSTEPRIYLENLRDSRRNTQGVTRSLGRGWVEEKLSAKLRRQNGEDYINDIRDQAMSFSTTNGFEEEFEKLNDIISALLATHQEGDVLVTDVAIAAARKVPYDPSRLDLFRSLADYLERCDLSSVPYTYNKAGWRNLSFFESYFSNYIEGTEFEIDEAEDIVFNSKVVNERHQDSHDVMAVFKQVSDYQEMSITPQSADELIELLQNHHFDMMKTRKDKRPGQFKIRVNKAGNSTFVLPDELIGTLTQAFEVYKNVPKGLKSAIFMQFMVSECHPFDDGNGRLSRIMMNAELHSADQFKVIVPTVHRESYLNGLRQATREGDFKALVKVFYQLQHYTASLTWNDYGEVRDEIEEHQAHLLPDEGIATFNRIIRKFRFVAP